MQHKQKTIVRAQERTNLAIAAFLESGGTIQQLENGDSAYNQPQRKRRSRTTNSIAKPTLTEANVVEIRKTLTAIEDRMKRIATKHKLAARFGVTYTCIDKVEKGERWTGISS